MSNNSTDILVNTLAGADDFYRMLPLNMDNRNRKKDRYVGVFYFLWLGQHGENGPYDIAEIVKQEPEAIYNAASPLWGELLVDYHHWGQPLFNYYFSHDPWVLRKHVQMLTIADVDFLIFDATNGVTYKKVYDVLMEILNETQSQGWKVPQIVFYTNTNSSVTVMDLYEDIYRTGRYKNLWFLWDNKPLIIGAPDQCMDEVKSFFTFRLPQWPNEPKRSGGFPWIDWNRPQEVYFDEKGEKEVISVSVAQHPKLFFGDSAFYGEKGNWGRGYHTMPVPEESLKHWGYNFIEQWEYAISQDPRIVFVTGWNEWVALRFNGDDERPVKFVDLASEEYSRDIEPMMGGYNDNYYMLLMSYIREFKGVWPLRKQYSPKTILINDDFSQWDDVKCVYRDFTGDTAPRNHSGFGGVTYKNFTGNNDFDIIKVSSDRENIYFYVKTVNPIVISGGAYCMTLLINSGGTYNKGWKGYDFAVNRLSNDPCNAVIEATKQGWNWEAIDKACCRIKNNEMHLAISRQTLGLNDGALTIHFKWLDNIQNENNIMDFYVNGDTAPDGRLNYVFTEE